MECVWCETFGMGQHEGGMMSEYCLNCEDTERKLAFYVEQARKAEAEQGRCVNDHASVVRITEWLNDDKRKPAVLAFTEGPERTMAYWFEKAWAGKPSDNG